ncbi:hypothetical protein BKA64DRAFT_708200 [Cadophora sp. MPI-SDFR-AT-0126]|nr:hypothetical protein BKA64DRAFT_708200 [Leotiomycetes sp. MPI-SDFR-AT-0126]
MHSVRSTIASCCADPVSETTSHENDATIPSDIGHDATGERLTANALPEDIQDDSHGEYQLLSATWMSQSFDLTGRVADSGHEAPLALTRGALQQHNIDNIPAVGRTTNTTTFHEHYMGQGFLDETAVYASALDKHALPKEQVEPYSYPRQCSKHHLSIALVKVDDHTVNADVGLPSPLLEDQHAHSYPACINEVDRYDHLLEDQDVHPYPTAINEVDLYDHLPESKLYNNPSNTTSSSSPSGPKEVSFQVLDLWSSEYAGIGTQFSS